MLHSRALLFLILLGTACNQQKSQEADSSSPTETESQQVLPAESLDTDDDGDGYSENQGDCNDSNDTINPQATEVCDGLDNDCDTLVDDEDASLDGATGSEYFTDNDGDGFGDIEGSDWYCEVPESMVQNGDDCNDENADIHPEAIELCDGIDNDCDFLIDADDPNIEEDCAQNE